MPGKDQRDMKQVGSKSKGDGKSRDGRKEVKGGKGGKVLVDGSLHYDNLNGDEAFDAALDRGDPNYDLDGESNDKPSVKIIYSKPGIEIVTKPFLVGEELEALSKQCSMDFIKALPEGTTNVVSLEILNGGHYYFVGPAFQEVHGVECPSKLYYQGFICYFSTVTCSMI